MDEMPNRGAIEAELYMHITGITTSLIAITAYPVDITDLMRSSTAFRRISLYYADKTVNKFLEQNRRYYRNTGKLERFGWRSRGSMQNENETRNRR